MNPLSGLPNHTRIILLFLIAFVIITVPLTSYRLSQNKNLAQGITSSPPTPTPNPTINWKTYTGLDYTIEHPVSVKESASTYNGSGGVVTMVTFDSGISILSYADGVNPRIEFNAKTESDTNAVIANQTVRKLVGKEVFSDKGTLIQIGPVKNNGENYMFTYTSGNKEATSQDLNTFDQILSTFKFTNQTNNYFNIPELGIRIKLTDGIKDLGYIYKNSTPYFYTNYLIEQAKEKGGVNYCTKDAGPIGTFLKIEKTSLKNDQNGPWDETIQGIRAETVGRNGFPPLAKEFSDYFLFFSHPNNTCSNNNSVGLLQQKQVNLLQESMQTAELTQ